MRELVWAALGLVVFGAQVAWLHRKLAAAPPVGLEVRAPAGPVRSASGALPADAQVTASARDQVQHTVDGQAVPARLSPGWHREAWSVTYGLVDERRVARSVIAGPFQDPAAPPCGVRLVIGQKLLDAAIPELKKLLGKAMREVPNFERVEALDIIFDGPSQSIVTRVNLRFGAGKIVVNVHLAPRFDGKVLHLEPRVVAHVEFADQIVNDLVNLIGQSKRLDGWVSRLAQSEVVKGIAPVVTILSRPPPVPLTPDGERQLPLAYCPGQPFTVHDRTALVVPLALVPPADMPPPPVVTASAPPSARPEIAAAEPLALELDLAAANAVVAHAQAAGLLDEALTRAGLDRRFNSHPEVEQWLTLRAGPVSLAAPPLLSPGPGPDSVRVDLELAFDVLDGETRTPAHLYVGGALSAHTDQAGQVRTSSQLADIDLSCIPDGVLSACYPLIVARGRAAAGALDAPIAAALRAWIEQLLEPRQVEAEGHRVVLDRPRLLVENGPSDAWLHVGWQITLQ